MKNTKKIFRKIDKFQEVILIIYLITCLIDLTVLPTIINPLKYVLKLTRYIIYIYYIIRSIKLFKESNSNNKYFFIGLIISLLVLLIAKEKSLIILLFILYANQNINIKKFLKKLFKVLFIAFFVIVLLSLFHIIPNWQYYRGPLIRYSLGYIYPTVMMSLYLLIVLLYCAIRNNNYNLFDISILSAFNIFLYVLSNARISFLSINIVLLYMFIKTNNKGKNIIDNLIGNKLIKIIVIGLPCLFYVLNMLLSIGYISGNSKAYRINQILSNRIRYSSEAIVEYGLEPFGEDIEWYGWGKYGYSEEVDYKNFKYNFVDSSYSRILFDYGYIVAAIIVCLYTILLYDLYKKKKYNYIFIITIILLWSFIDPIIFNIGQNPFLLLFANYFNKKNKLTI